MRSHGPSVAPPSLPSLIAKYRARLDLASVPGVYLDPATVYREIVADLEALTPDTGAPLSHNTTEAARVLGVSKKTVAHWCESGRFPHARKTAEGRAGIWCIPASDIYAELQRQQREAA